MKFFAAEEVDIEFIIILGLQFSGRPVILNDIVSFKVHLFDVGGSERFHQILIHFAWGN